MMPPPRAPLLVLAALASLSCGDPTGASDDPEILLPGREASGNVSARDTAWYRHPAAAGEAFSAILSVRSGSVSLIVRDSIGRTVTAPISAAYAAPIVGRAETGLIVPRIDSRYQILVTGDGDYRIEVVLNPNRPEGDAAIVAFERIVDEAIDRGDDVDDFFVFGRPGDLLIAYLQTLNPAGAGSALLLVSDSAGTAVASAASTGAPAEIETQPSDRWIVVDSGAYRLRVRGPDVGGYRLMVRRIDPGPEAGPALLVPNDTVGSERIDFVGDVDEFTIRGPVGAELNLMLRFLSADSSATALAQVGGAEVTGTPPEITSSGRDSLLADRATGTFRLGASGEATVRIEGVGLARGPYQVLAYRINRAPEGNPPGLALSDTVSETIELPGDVDEYALELAAEDTLTVEVGPALEHGRAGFHAQVRNGSGAIVAETFHSGEAVVGMEPVWLPGGRYTVAVAGSAGLDGVRGPYRLTTHRIRRSPESASGVFAIGDTVTEAIEPAGDIDFFQFDAQRGDYLDLRFQWLSESETQPWVLFSPSGGLLAHSEGTVPMPTLDDFGSGRLVVQESGPHQVFVSSGNRGLRASERGRYRFTIRRYPSTPEHHAERLTPGDVVTDELVDQLGDIDQFAIEGIPGTEIAVHLTAPTGLGSIRVEVLDAATREVIAFTASEGGFRSTGRVVLPASGTLLVRVGEMGRPSAFARTGGYRLEVFRVNRAPETRPAAIAIGDTVTSESIEPVADVDEFSFAGVAGQRIAGLLDVPMGTSPPGIRLEIITPGGSLLTSVATPNPSDPFGTTRTPVVSLPVSGSYRARLLVIDPAATEGARYRFAIVAQ